MHLSTLFFGYGLAPLALAAYTIQDDYSGYNFFSMFTFDTENDPTSGYVNYVDGVTAQADNLTSVNNGVVTIASDSTNVASGRGRNSVRLTSIKQYTHALVILDLAHMPGSACGIWPAFWMTGPSWPNNGEIDIIEGISLQTQNAITMHSGPSCTMLNEPCTGGTGCSTQAGGPTSYGTGLNTNNGGIYAMEWTSASISIWFFPHSTAPADISSDAPDPSTWSAAPLASFQGGSGCDIDANFQNNNIVLDTTFCGDWAGAVWSSDPLCGAKADTCVDYVQNNPDAFTEAYWAINSLKVYSESDTTTNAAAAVAEDDAPGQTSTPPPPPSPSAAPPSQSQFPSPSASTSTPTPPSGTVAVGIPATGGALSEIPVADNESVSVGSDGVVVETPEKVRRSRRAHLRRHRAESMFKHS